jgi:hypothetical protein
MFFSILNDLKRGLIVRFVDIGGITDYHCLNFLSKVTTNTLARFPQEMSTRI